MLRLTTLRFTTLSLTSIATLAWGADDAATLNSDADTLKATASADLDKASKDLDEASQLQVSARNAMLEANAKRKEAETAAHFTKEQSLIANLQWESDSYRQTAKGQTTEAQSKLADVAADDKTIQSLTATIADLKAKGNDADEVKLLDEVLKNDQAEAKSEQTEADRLKIQPDVDGVWHLRIHAVNS